MKEQELVKNTVTIHWSDWPAALLFVALFVVVFLQLYTRFLLNDSLAWTEEVARYLLIGLVYLGSVAAVRKGEHILLEFLYRKVGSGNIKPMAIMSETIVVAFHVILTILAVQLSFVADRRMVSIDWPKSLVYSVVAFGLLLSTWFAARRLVHRWGQSTEEIGAEVDEIRALQQEEPT